ncbi:hypothetical protein RYX36_005038 [Vicia faba]
MQPKFSDGIIFNSVIGRGLRLSIPRTASRHQEWVKRRALETVVKMIPGKDKFKEMMKDDEISWLWINEDNKVLHKVSEW